MINKKKWAPPKEKKLKSRKGAKPETEAAKTPEEQIEVNGVTLADFQKMLGPALDEGLQKVASTLFMAAAAAVKQGKGAALAVAYSAFFPLAEILANDISRWVTTEKRRNDASTVKALCEAIAKLDEMEDRTLREKLAARLDDLVDQVFPAPFKLNMVGALLDPSTWAPLEVDRRAFMKEEMGAVKEEPPSIAPSAAARSEGVAQTADDLE